MANDEKYIIGLDISTTTIGASMFLDRGAYGDLKLLQAIQPKIRPRPETKLEELFKKADVFKNEFLNKYIDWPIKNVVVEEPLLQSNNVNVVATLLRFNGILSKQIYDLLGIVPRFISSYDARKFAFPELMAVRKYNKRGEPYYDKEIARGRAVLFGGFQIGIDKKEVIQKLVSNEFPKISWPYDHRGILKSEAYDMSDSIACVLGYYRKMGIWK